MRRRNRTEVDVPISLGRTFVESISVSLSAGRVRVTSANNVNWRTSNDRSSTVNNMQNSAVFFRASSKTYLHKIRESVTFPSHVPSSSSNSRAHFEILHAFLHTIQRGHSKVCSHPFLLQWSRSSLKETTAVFSMWFRSSSHLVSPYARWQPNPTHPLFVNFLLEHEIRYKQPVPCLYCHFTQFSMSSSYSVSSQLFPQIFSSSW